MTTFQDMESDYMDHFNSTIIEIETPRVEVGFGLDSQANLGKDAEARFGVPRSYGQSYPSCFKIKDNKILVTSKTDCNSFHLLDRFDKLPYILWMKYSIIFQYMLGNSLLIRVDNKEVKSNELTLKEKKDYANFLTKFASSYGLFEESADKTELVEYNADKILRYKDGEYVTEKRELENVLKKKRGWLPWREYETLESKNLKEVDDGKLGMGVKTIKFHSYLLDSLDNSLQNILRLSNDNIFNKISVLRGQGNLGSYDYYAPILWETASTNTIRDILDKTTGLNCKIVSMLTGTNMYTLEVDDKLLQIYNSFAHIFEDYHSRGRFFVMKYTADNQGTFPPINSQKSSISGDMKNAKNFIKSKEFKIFTSIKITTTGFFGFGKIKEEEISMLILGGYDRNLSIEPIKEIPEDIYSLSYPQISNGAHPGGNQSFMDAVLYSESTTHFTSFVEDKTRYYLVPYGSKLTEYINVGHIEHEVSEEHLKESLEEYKKVNPRVEGMSRMKTLAPEALKLFEETKVKSLKLGCIGVLFCVGGKNESDKDDMDIASNDIVKSYEEIIKCSYEAKSRRMRRTFLSGEIKKNLPKMESSENSEKLSVMPTIEAYWEAISPNDVTKSMIHASYVYHSHLVTSDQEELLKKTKGGIMKLDALREYIFKTYFKGKDVIFIEEKDEKSLNGRVNKIIRGEPVREGEEIKTSFCISPEDVFMLTLIL